MMRPVSSTTPPSTLVPPTSTPIVKLMRSCFHAGLQSPQCGIDEHLLGLALEHAQQRHVDIDRERVFNLGSGAGRCQPVAAIHRLDRGAANEMPADLVVRP